MRIVTVLAVAASIGCSSTPRGPASVTPRGRTIIVEGTGFADVRLGHVTAAELRERFGKPAREIEHGTYSVELVYASGMHAYYCQSDARQRIFSLELAAPFDAVTKKGITRGVSTMQDVLDAYGEAEWTTTSAEEEWSLEYDGLGVRFNVLITGPDKEFQERYVDRTVDFIDVKLAPHYQCDDPFPEDYQPPQP